MITKVLLEGFLLGLATGHLCVATCGPIYAPFLMQKEQGGVKGSLMIILKISLGRFAAYGLFGLAAGAIGSEISSINRTWFTIISYILLSAMLVNSVVITKKVNHSGCAVSKWGKLGTNPVILGILTGINFCPSFLIAITNAVNLTGPLSGFILFTAFFVGTNIFLIPFTLFGIMGSRKVFQKIAFYSSIVVAIWFTIQAGMMIRNEVMPDSHDIVTILDTTPVHIVTDTPEKFAGLADQLRKEYQKVVTIGNKTPIFESRLYIFVDFAKGPDAAKAMMRPNTFVILLPEKFSNAEDITHFMKEYHFRFDSKNGSFFSMDELHPK